MSKFQLIITVIILFLIVLAVLVLSGAIPGLPGQTSGPIATLVLWGTFPQAKMLPVTEEINSLNKTFSIKYIEKEKEAYEAELVDAIASGRGPDIFFLTQDLLLKHRGKVLEIPFAAFSERTFKDTFIDAGEMFLSENGIMAMPLLADPIVLYWNRDLFNKAGLANPPKYWDEFLNFSQLLTKNDSLGNIVESGAAMGEFSNINNAKDIFSMLILQSGNKIVTPKIFTLTFGERGNLTVEPAASALAFFASFSNPSKVSYSWNMALPNSSIMFSSGKLAMYFGFSGELKNIQQRNPHLNFDASFVPQMKDSSFQATFAVLHGLAVSKISSNGGEAVKAAFAFLNEDSWRHLQENLFLPSASRKILSGGSSDPFLSVFLKSALQARAWLEPDSAAGGRIFKDMIEAVSTGRKNISNAVSDAKQLLEAEMKKIKN
ncbi:extracellular solute-binding protein [Patescibacteria group bacterium]|nr:extracellular solute-binding protein [Patescibacteria group bacterium]